MQLRMLYLRHASDCTLSRFITVIRPCCDAVLDHVDSGINLVGLRDCEAYNAGSWGLT